MIRSEDRYPTLVVVSLVLVLIGCVVLLAPRYTPPPYVATVAPLAELWLLGVVSLGIGGTLAALLALRSVV